MELRIEPAVVKRVGLSEYVFYYDKQRFPTNFSKNHVRQKIPSIYTEPVLSLLLTKRFSFILLFFKPLVYRALDCNKAV